MRRLVNGNIFRPGGHEHGHAPTVLSVLRMVAHEVALLELDRYDTLRDDPRFQKLLANLK